MVFLPSSEATLNFVNYRKYFPDIPKKKKSKLHIDLSTHFKNSYNETIVINGYLLQNYYE